MVVAIIVMGAWGLRGGAHETYTGFMEAAKKNDVPAFITAFSGGAVFEWDMGESWSWRAVPGYMRTSMTVSGTDITLYQVMLGAGPVFRRGNNYAGGLLEVSGFGLVTRELSGAVEAPHYGGMGAEVFAGRGLWGPLFVEMKLSGSVFPTRSQDKEGFYGFAFLGLELGALIR